MKQKFIDAYMDTAVRFSKLSTARRLNVGSIIVKDDRIISIGYNGTPAGWDNNCEILLEDGTLKTKPETIHAEANAVAKLAKYGESGQNATMFVTHAPCMECAKTIYVSGIIELYYLNDYRSSEGLDFLKKCGIRVVKM